MLKRLAAVLAAGMLLISGWAWAADRNNGEHPQPPEPEPVNVVVLSTNPADYAVPVAPAAFGLQEGDAVDFSFFDDAVFVGDSISLKLHHYVRARRKEDENFMGKADFLVAGSMGSGNALWPIDHKESVHPSYKGEKMLLEDAIKKMGAKKVYIMLGINDVALYGQEGSIENMETLVDRILEKSPEAQIYLQSATPRIAASTSRPNNRMIFDYDLALYELSLRRGWNFVDVASVMRDANGNLYDSYCSDAPTMGMHFTDEACQVWIDYLMTHTSNEEE